MEQDTKEKAIVEWLRKVDKPVKTKEGDKKDKRSRDE
jgi:transcriptional regulator of NAD metabolism